MHDFGHLPAAVSALAVLALALFLSLYYAAGMGLAVRWSAGAAPTRRVLAFAALWLGAELARASWFTGFPWIASGYAHAQGPLAALAPYVGVYGITAVAALPAAALALRHCMTGAAFVGAIGAVLLTLVLARGVTQSLRLLLAGVVVGVVLGSGAALLTLMNPDILRAMQAFMLGSTGYVGWSAVQVMAVALGLCLLTALGCSRTLDALTLGEDTARSLGQRLTLIRLLLIATLSLATGAAVAQCGLIAFVGLVAPHLVRSWGPTTHGALLLLSALTGGALLLAADIAARWVIAPQELPVGIITALLGGSYLLWLMHRRKAHFGGAGGSQ
ncbi:iron chelate uptake ABC transporter family permease subunit [Mitsuaria sp. TWR114]|nr:iron chelate uptake ABC transporter family permease subunit [Mitsuaria sp. TWR114]